MSLSEVDDCFFFVEENGQEPEKKEKIENIITYPVVNSTLMNTYSPV